MIEKMLEEQDYDSGLLNNNGGGDVGWWHDYIRFEVAACNEYWRSIILCHTPQDNQLNEADKLDIDKNGHG